MENIPNFLIDKLNNEYGEITSKEIVDGYCIERISSFRINSLKSSLDEVEDVLKSNGIFDYEIDRYDGVDRIILNKELEGKVKELEVYKDGKIYFQSLSSMLPPLFLELNEGEDILDMCAAPGGKTTEMAAIVNNKANITAIEFNKQRCEKLKHNIEMQGAKCSVLQKDSRRLDDFLRFDKILLDAPCSGSGTLSDKENNSNYTQDLINKCKRLQIELLNKACKLIKKNQVIVYSTCSILKEENEEIVNKILSQFDDIYVEEIDIKEDDKLKLMPSDIKGTITVMPNKYYEGFYIAKLRKK